MVSNEFINECKNRANSNRLGQLIVDEMDKPITQSDKLHSFTIDSGCYVDGNIIGSVYVKKLTGKILDSANVSLVDKTIQAKIGVKYIDNSTEYLNIGKYTIERPTAEKTVNMSEFTAYNGLINKLDDKYVCNIDYSKGNITLTDLYKDVCSQMNLTPTTITFDNSSIPISANPFTNGEKNRTVLQVIAKIAGSWIEIDDDSNEVDLHWLSQNSEPDYIFNLNDYSTVEGGEITCGPINCLIIKNSQVDDENITITDDESIALYGENSIVINEDYILYNSNLRQQAINAIWNKVHGLNYVDCKLITYYGKPFLKLGDKIRIYTNETEYFDTYVLKHNFTYDGTFTSVIESPVLTKQEIKNKQNVSLGELLRNTRIDVNKQEQKINLAVETAQEAYDKVEVYNPVLESTGNGQLKLQDSAGEDLLEFIVDGKSEQNGTPTPSAPIDIKSISGVENLLDKNATQNGVAWNNSSVSSRATNYVSVKPNTIYTLSWSNNTLTGSPKIYVAQKSSNTSTSALGDGASSNNENGILTIETSSETYVLAVQFMISSGIITTSDYENIQIQLEEGSIANDYVPYGSNYLVEKVVGKNKLNLGNETFSRLGLTSIVNGSEWKINGTSTGSEYIRNPHLISLGKFKAGTYTFHINSDDITTTNIAFGLRNVDENINFFNGSVQNKTSIFTLTKETELGVSIWNQGTGNVINGTIYLQLEEGSQATEYEEYKETISLIDLKDNKLCSNKEQTIKDKLIVKNGLASIDKKFKEIVLDGSQTVTSMASSNKNRVCKVVLTDLAVSIATNIVCNAFSNKFKPQSGNDTYLEKNGISVFGDTVTFYYDVINTYTNDQFKEWLTNNPITLQYELATPQTIDLGEVSIQTVQSDCTLELEEELDTNMYAKYIKNNPYNEAYSTRLDTKTQIQLSENKIESSVSETILQNTELMQGEIDSLSSNLANNYMTSEEVQNLNNLTNESLAVITNEFKQVQTSTQTQFQAITNILQNGVSLVKTTYTTIDDEGIKIAKSTDSFNSTFDNKGLKLYSYTDLMAVYTNKGAGVSNLLVTGTMDLGYSKIMKVTLNGKKYTGIFYSDAMAQTLEDFISED